MAAQALYATRFANGKKLLEVYARDVTGLATSLRGSDEHSMLPLGGVVANSYTPPMECSCHHRWGHHQCGQCEGTYEVPPLGHGFAAAGSRSCQLRALCLRPYGVAGIAAETSGRQGRAS